MRFAALASRLECVARTQAVPAASLARKPRAPDIVDPPGYARHRHETTLLYQLIEQHYPAFRLMRAMAGRTLHVYVEGGVRGLPEVREAGRSHRSRSDGSPLVPGGFSLHAGVTIEPHQREKLERLCRYVSRPPVAIERLALASSGQVCYQIKTPYRDGNTLRAGGDLRDCARNFSTSCSICVRVDALDSQWSSPASST